MAPIEWHRDLADSPAGRIFAYAQVGSGTGLALLIALLVLVSLPGIAVVLWANPAVAALVALFALVGGPLSMAYLWPVLTERAQRQPLLASSYVSDLPLPGVLVGTIVGACVHALAFRIHPTGPIVVLAGGVILGSLGVGLHLTEGGVDPNARTLLVRPSVGSRESSGRTIDLRTWTDVVVYRLGSVVVLRPSYTRGVRGPNPGFVPLPADVADDVLPVVHDAIEEEAPDSGRPPNPAVAATLVAFGLGTMALGVAAVLLEIGPAGYRAYALALSVLLGAVFLGAAWREY